MTVTLKRKYKKYPDLTYGQYYTAIGIEADDFRLLNDYGRPYLYPNRLFEVVDPREPLDWVSETGGSGEHYAYPPELNSSGFFEDFFDGKKQAVTIFWHAVNQRMAFMAKAG
jgi:hypothetical protein